MIMRNNDNQYCESTINHHQSSSIIINHHQSSSIIIIIIIIITTTASVFQTKICRKTFGFGTQMEA